MTAETGIDFRHHDGSRGQYYIVETMSGGVALLDYDGDGDEDTYFLNGSPQPPDGSAHETSSSARAVEGANKDRPRNALYRNDGDWKFTDVTEQAGVGDPGHGLGVAAGDYDNDGDADLYVNNFGPNVLYRNNGDGTFTDVTERAGVACGNRVGAGVSFLDIDADGDLDLYVANYIKFDYGLHVPRTKSGYPIYGSPQDYQPEPDVLYRNNGDGTFTDVSDESGIAAYAAPSMGIVAADYDADGDADVLVANDGVENYLFRNDGAGRFEEVALISGFAYDGSGLTHASMGVDCADYDNDGGLDFHVTSYQNELATLYRNVGGAFLEDVTSLSGAGAGTLLPVTWGNGFADFDNDGDRDLLIACGHLYDQMEHFDRSTKYNEPNVLLENVGGGKFANVSQQCGDGLRVGLSTRGLALGDLDNDGDMDAVLLNTRREPTLLRNESASGNHWLEVRLRGATANADGVGARVEVQSGNLTQVDEVHSGRGYQAHFGTRLHFGLGDRTTVDRIRVRWPGGRQSVVEDVIENVDADQQITITQGERDSR